MNDIYNIYIYICVCSLYILLMNHSPNCFAGPRLQQGIHLGLKEQLDRLRVVRDRGPAEGSAAVTAARVDFGTTGEEELQHLP